MDFIERTYCTDIIQSYCMVVSEIWVDAGLFGGYHTPHPSHLVGGFEVFGYAFLFGAFFYQPRKENLCFFLYIGEVGMEFAGSEQIVI